MMNKEKYECTLSKNLTCSNLIHDDLNITCEGCLFWTPVLLSKKSSDDRSVQRRKALQQDLPMPHFDKSQESHSEVPSLLEKIAMKICLNGDCYINDITLHCPECECFENNRCIHLEDIKEAIDVFVKKVKDEAVKDFAEKLEMMAKGEL